MWSEQRKVTNIIANLKILTSQGPSEVVPWVKVLATNPKKLHSVPRTHTVEDEN